MKSTIWFLFGIKNLSVLPNYSKPWWSSQVCTSIIFLTICKRKDKCLIIAWKPWTYSLPFNKFAIKLSKPLIYSSTKFMQLVSIRSTRKSPNSRLQLNQLPNRWGLLEVFCQPFQPRTFLRCRNLLLNSKEKLWTINILLEPTAKSTIYWSWSKSSWSTNWQNN